MMLEILSPEKTLFSGEVQRVTLPGAAGEFTVLPHHAPIISSLAPGRVRYLPAGGAEQTVEVGGGFVEVNDDRVSVCVAG